jgi:hypothetical protein
MVDIFKDVDAAIESSAKKASETLTGTILNFTKGQSHKAKVHFEMGFEDISKQQYEKFSRTKMLLNHHKPADLLKLSLGPYVKALVVCFALACGINVARAEPDSVVGLILECTGKRTLLCSDCGDWNGAVLSHHETLKFLSDGEIEESCFHYTVSAVSLKLECKRPNSVLNISIDRIAGTYVVFFTSSNGKFIFTGNGSCSRLPGPKF